MDYEATRRRVLGSIAAVTAAGTLAGCSGGGGNGGDGDGNTPVMVEPPSDVSEYLSDANNFDGQMADATEVSSPTVMVGAGDGLAFDPAAIKVSTGTTITWEWTGEGGTHNVVAQDDTFDSGSAVVEAGTTFEYTFDSSGTYPYYCEPHQDLNMLGAVVVE